MEEHLAWGFPKEKLQQHVFAREPTSAGELMVWCVDTSSDNSCCSGLLVTLKAMVTWSPSEIKRYELSKIERPRLREALKGHQINFVYEDQSCTVELPLAYEFRTNLLAKTGEKAKPWPDASNVASCRIPDQASPLARLLLLFFAGGRRALKARVGNTDEVSQLVYRKAWATVDDEFLFLTPSRHRAASLPLPEHEPVRNIRRVATRSLGAGAQVRAAFFRGLWPTVGLGVLILVGVLIGVGGSEVPTERIVLGVLASLIGGFALGLLLMVLPDALGATALTLYVLETTSGGPLVIGADARQQPQVSRLIQELEKESKMAIT